MNKLFRISACVLAATVFSGNVQAADAVPFKHNSKTPIDISADALEVQQQDGRAIFTGHVVAIQGEVRLTAEKMTVYYRKQEESAKDKKTTQNAIRKIEVEKNVFLTTAEETASGDSGVYDVEKQQIILDKNVVLTKDKNTLKGDNLVYDFSTGKSVLNSRDVATTGAGEQKGKQRVRALFVPDDSEKKKP